MFRHRAELQRWHYGCGNSLPAGGFKKEVDKASPAALTIDVHPEWPMVGRGPDLKALREAYARADEAPVAFLITGEAGIGKSGSCRSSSQHFLRVSGIRVMHQTGR